MKLEYYFDCLDGQYRFTGELSEGVLFYNIDSSIAEFESRQGRLSNEDSEVFIRLLHRAGIEKWDERYEAQGEGIEDAISWKVKLTDEEGSYVSQGEESFEPYGYEYLITALKLCEEKADYFAAAGQR